MEEIKTIPQINISDNKVILDTKEVPLVVNDKEVNIKMQKLPTGDKQILIKQSAGTKIVGSQVQGTVDAIGYQIGLLSKVIIEAPFPTDEASIRTLPDEVTEYLFSEYSEWIKPKKKV